LDNEQKLPYGMANAMIEVFTKFCVWQNKKRLNLLQELTEFLKKEWIGAIIKCDWEFTGQIRIKSVTSEGKNLLGAHNIMTNDTWLKPVVEFHNRTSRKNMLINFHKSKSKRLERVDNNNR
jgi:hypothetical protein